MPYFLQEGDSSVVGFHGDQCYVGRGMLAYHPRVGFGGPSAGPLLMPTAPALHLLLIQPWIAPSRTQKLAPQRMMLLTDVLHWVFEMSKRNDLMAQQCSKVAEFIVHGNDKPSL